MRFTTANRLFEALGVLFKAPKSRGGKEVIAERQIETTSVGVGAGDPLSVYPRLRYADGRPASQSFDFPPNVNLNTKTDAFRNISYGLLRWFADNHLVTRAAINVRVNEIVGLDWDIVPKDGAKAVSKEAKRKVKEFWQSPDRNDDFGQWLNRLLEDLFVVDAPCLEIRRTLNGDFYGLDVIDGTTIKIVLDDSGRIPKESVAYQQIIKGQNICDFMPGELIYNPRKNTSHSPYGKSALESCLLEVNTTLRALTSILNFFTVGKVPPGFIIAPESVVTASNFAEFASLLTEILKQNDQVGSELLALPFGSEYQSAKDINFQNFTELRDYLNQEILMAFEVQPQEVGLTYQVNKSTGEQQENITYRRAIKPLTQFLENIFYRINRDLLGAPDLKFQFIALEAEDKFSLAGVHQIYSQEQIMTKNEIRAEVGLDPVEGGDEFPEPAPALNNQLFAHNWADIEKELGKWERKALNGKEGFLSDILPSDIIDEVEVGLLEAKTPEAVKGLFEAVKKKYQTQGFGKRSTALSKRTFGRSPARSRSFILNGGKASLPSWANPYQHSRRSVN